MRTFQIASRSGLAHKLEEWATYLRTSSGIQIGKMLVHVPDRMSVGLSLEQTDGTTTLAVHLKWPATSNDVEHPSSVNSPAFGD